MLTLLIVDDEMLIADSLCQLLNSAFSGRSTAFTCRALKAPQGSSGLREAPDENCTAIPLS